MFDNINRGSVKPVQPAGDVNAKICIVGDFTDGYDLVAGRPFAGPAGSALESCLHAAGLIRGEVYLTSVVKVPPSRGIKAGKLGPNGEFFILNDSGKGTFTERGQEWVSALHDELSSIHANVFVAAGPAAFAALCGGRKLGTFRGYVRQGTVAGKSVKVIPTFSPADTVRGRFVDRTVISIDLTKAKLESEYPEIRRPERKLIFDFQNVQEALAWMKALESSPFLAFDIEVVNYEVACISFSNSPTLGVVIPITDRWTEDEEILIWRGIQSLLGNEHSVKIAQNAIFDIHFLLTRNGVEVKGTVHDTMIGHSVMYPDLPKGLGFLGSIYCGATAYWKDLVKFDDIKDES